MNNKPIRISSVPLTIQFTDTQQFAKFRIDAINEARDYVLVFRMTY